MILVALDVHTEHLEFSEPYNLLLSPAPFSSSIFSPRAEFSAELAVDMTELFIANVLLKCDL